jgi:hypothetical protein
MSLQVEIVCKCGCGRKRLVRKADRDRGWGLFFNKSCKARHQEKRTGQYASYLQSSVRSEVFSQVSQEPWDDHKSYCRHDSDYHPFSPEAFDEKG